MKTILLLMATLTLTGCRTLVAPVQPAGAQAPPLTAAAATATRSRHLAVVLDQTVHQAHLAHAVARVEATLAALGPGDRAAVAVCGGLEFRPARDAIVVAVPPIDPSVLRPTTNVAEYSLQQAALDGAWRQATTLQTAARDRLRARLALRQPAGTPLHAAVRWCAAELTGDETSERSLVVVSDLFQQVGAAQATQTPPAAALGLGQATVRLEHVLDASTPGVERWRTWAAADGATVEVEEIAQALASITPFVAPCPVPRAAPSPF